MFWGFFFCIFVLPSLGFKTTPLQHCSTYSFRVMTNHIALSARSLYAEGVKLIKILSEYIYGSQEGGGRSSINTIYIYWQKYFVLLTRAIFWSSCIGYLIQMEQDITPVMSSYIYNQSLFTGHRSRNLLWYMSWSLVKPSVEFPSLLILGFWLFHDPSVWRIYIVLPKFKTQFLGKRSYKCVDEC